MDNQFIICGIDTDCGKSTASVLLHQYFKEKLNKNSIIIKPLQTGKNLDTDFYTSCGIPQENIINFETYRSETSLHLAALLEQKNIQLEHIVQQIIKQVESHSLSPVIIEMAGGIMSPINQKQSMLDIVKAVNLPVILVVSSYLGSLNHTLLTLKVLQSEGIDIFGIIFNQVRTVDGIITDSNEYIKNLTELPILGYIPYLNDYKQRMKSENDKNRLIKNWRV